MNVIVSNKYQYMLENLGIDIIKNLNGEHTVDEIISTFQNFYYQRMILDITAIKNYKDLKNLQKLSISLDMDKVILLLDDDPESTSIPYLSNLISMGIYNFTRNVEGIQYLYNHPNSYRDVAQFHQIGVQPQPQPMPMPQPGQPQQVNNGANVQPQPIPQPMPQPEIHMKRVIGIKNVTSQAGATTLTYMMRNELAKHYNVVAIEVEKTDFTYFKDNNLVSANRGNFMSILNRYSNCDVILIDVNNNQEAISRCDEIIYLIEPSMIKLNKITMTLPQTLKDLKNKKIVLNKSLLNSKDVLDFEYESKLKVFYNLPPLDEREKNIQVLKTFLVKFGFDKMK